MESFQDLSVERELKPAAKSIEDLASDKTEDIDLRTTVFSSSEQSQDSDPSQHQRGVLEGLLFTTLGLLNPKQRDTVFAQAIEIAKGTALLLAAEVAVVSAFSAIGLQAGNAEGQSIEDDLLGSPLQSFAMFALLIPAMEEIGCRWLPSKMSDWGAKIISSCSHAMLPEEVANKVDSMVGDKNSKRWFLGAAMAVPFALLHNITEDPNAVGISLGEGLTLSTTDIPLPQFMFGLFAWNLMRKFGLGASLFSHVLSNSVALGVILGANALNQ